MVTSVLRLEGSIKGVIIVIYQALLPEMPVMVVTVLRVLRRKSSYGSNLRKLLSGPPVRRNLCMKIRHTELLI